MKNYTTLYNYLFILIISLFTISCTSDDDDIAKEIIIPSNYEFLRDGVSTVSFSGQTTRLKQVDEIYSALNANTYTEAQLDEMFTDGAAADRYLEFEGADIAIIDINLPGMDGITLTRRLRQRKQTFPVIMLTANSETPDRVKGLDAGADDYLIKPFAMAELEARIRALSRRRPELAPDHETIGKLTLSRRARRLFYSDTQEEIIYHVESWCCLKPY